MEKYQVSIAKLLEICTAREHQQHLHICTPNSPFTLRFHVSWHYIHTPRESLKLSSLTLPGMAWSDLKNKFSLLGASG